MEFLLLKPSTLIHLTGWSLMFSAVAIGLNLIWYISDFFNIAHGTFFMLSIFLFVFLRTFNISFYLILFIAPFIIALLSVILKKTIFWRVEGDMAASVLLTIGLAMVLRQFVLMVFGGGFISAKFPITSSTTFLGQEIPNYDLFMIFLLTFTLLLFFFFLKWTRTGKYIRAISNNRDEAAVSGINVDRYTSILFLLCMFITGLGAILAVPYMGGHYLMGIDILIIAYMIMAVGGLGSIKGTVLAAFIFSFSEYFLLGWFSPTIARVISLGILIGIVLKYPNGLFGEEL